MHDTITIGTIGGFISTAIFLVADWAIAAIFEINYTSSIAGTASIYLNPDYIYTISGYILGTVNTFLLGSTVGVLVAITLKIFGKDYYFLKGIGVALMWKMATFGILAPIAHITPNIKNEPQTMLLAMMNFFIMGIVSSFIAKKYMKKGKYRLTRTLKNI
ncbi:MAG: hypothetical protein ACOWWO_01100 [Peptococcaceae bacterium]